MEEEDDDDSRESRPLTTGIFCKISTRPGGWCLITLSTSFDLLVRAKYSRRVRSLIPFLLLSLAWQGVLLYLRCVADGYKLSYILRRTFYMRLRYVEIIETTI